MEDTQENNAYCLPQPREPLLAPIPGAGSPADLPALLPGQACGTEAAGPLPALHSPEAGFSLISLADLLPDPNQAKRPH